MSDKPPNENAPPDPLRLTRSEFVEIVRMGRDVRYIRERIDELLRSRDEIVCDLSRHSNRLTALEVRFWIMSILVPALAAVASMLLGKLL
jgi:hypothetical protein